MVALIVLNIILIIILVFLLIYLFNNKKDNVKSDCIINECSDEIEIQNKKINLDRVFEGRFVTDEEYQQMMKYKRSDVSILLEEVEREYEHLKELNK